MAKTTIDTWNPHFLNASPVFNTIKPVALYHCGHTQWPSLKQLAKQFKESEHPLIPVVQGDKPDCFEDHYEPRIYLKHELQTRTENWHDFFNAMVWLTFRESKSVLNKLHYFSALQREPGSNRSQLENAITLFDECGIIIISDDEQLLDMIRQHQWKQLFYLNRHRFNNKIFCYVFGHAMYEKALKPYIGMTCQALLINSDSLVQSCKQNSLEDIDHYIANHWNSLRVKSSSDLTPFPLLGIPGLCNENTAEAFYDNTDYFRPLKKPE